MLSFSLSIILIPYLLFLLIIIFFSFINLRNLARYRPEDVISFFALFIFLSGLAAIGYLTWNYLSEIDWTKIIEVGLPTIKTSF